MLTIFTTTKPFEGHINIIQKNAIRSWLLLEPKPEIIIMGNEKGTNEFASEHGLIHIPDIKCNEYGTPFISSMFEEAQQIASNNIICYANADIIFLQSIIDAITIISGRFNQFLIVGQRINLDIREPLDFSSGWSEQLLSKAFLKGVSETKYAIDYFIFNRWLYKKLQPLLIARGYWDNWLIYKARALGHPVIDITQVTKVIHQNHDYKTYFEKQNRPNDPGIHNTFLGMATISKSEEGQRNRQLTMAKGLNIDDADYRLTPQGLKKYFTPIRIAKKLYSKIGDLFITPATTSYKGSKIVKILKAIKYKYL